MPEDELLSSGDHAVFWWLTAASQPAARWDGMQELLWQELKGFGSNKIVRREARYATVELSHIITTELDNMTCKANTWFWMNAVIMFQRREDSRTTRLLKIRNYEWPCATSCFLITSNAPIEKNQYLENNSWNFVYITHIRYDLLTVVQCKLIPWSISMRGKQRKNKLDSRLCCLSRRRTLSLIPSRASTMAL